LGWIRSGCGDCVVFLGGWRVYIDQQGESHYGRDTHLFSLSGSVLALSLVKNGNEGVSGRNLGKIKDKATTLSPRHPLPHHNTNRSFPLPWKTWLSDNDIRGKWQASDR